MRIVALTALALTTTWTAGCGPRASCGTPDLEIVAGRCQCVNGGEYVCTSPTTCHCDPPDGGPQPDAGCNADGRMICTETCVDTRTSPEHCGACGTPCAAPNVCLASRCVDAVVEIEQAGTHSCARRESGVVSCWGANGSGQLGDGTTVARREPVVIAGIDAVEISAGGSDLLGRGVGTSTCARDASGSVSCWGWITSPAPGTVPPSPMPVAVTGLAPATQISVGGLHACALHASGGVSCWGDDTSGQLGDGMAGAVTTTASTVVGIASAVQVSCGLRHTCATLSDGQVLCWGAGTHGELGRGGSDSAVPLTVAGLANVAEVRAGVDCTCARDMGGTVWCWGDNRLGCLGREAFAGSTPIAVMAPRDFEQLFDTRHGAMCGERAGGIVDCWGAMWGRESMRDGGIGEAIPVRRTDLEGVPAVALSLRTECAISSAGGVVCRGDNLHGQLGDGTAVSSDSFVTVLALP
jgi:alpha-tubulin suppressor-like RCC1 family protein